MSNQAYPVLSSIWERLAKTLDRYYSYSCWLIDREAGRAILISQGILLRIPRDEIDDMYFDTGGEG